MNITPEVFYAYLKCPTKCWLRATGEYADDNPYAIWVKEQNFSYREIETARLVAATSPDEVSLTPNIKNAKAAMWRMACSWAVKTEMGSHVLKSDIHMIERLPATGRGKAAQFIPIRFVFTNKLGKDDKLLLAYDAAVLSKELKRELPLGKIIHGDDRATLKVKTAALAGEVRKRLDKIATLISNPAPPDLVLNRHCSACEFQARCRKIAVEKDDLSQLAGMSEKERQKLRSKGIFTVTQLSYTFRPRRRSKRLRDKREKYHHALKALAIREKKIHIVGSPELKIEGTPVYLDVEGLPDRNFYYLIGIRIGDGESAVQHSLWADSLEDEGKIWRKFLAILETVENPVLIHYGSYETTFINRMRERLGEPPDDSVAARAIKAGVNLLSVIYARVYFPSFSNGLKEIVGNMGFRWSDSIVTGISTISRRQEWEGSRASAIKKSLITYNTEDCAALEVVAHKLLELYQNSPPAKISSDNDVVDTNKFKREHPYGFKRNIFALPELNVINSAAYWDYQRERVYVKSDKRLMNVVRKSAKLSSYAPPNRIVECARPRSCPKCKSSRIFAHTKSSKIVLDLRFMQHGIKRWITRYHFHNYQCQNCGAVFRPQEESWPRGKHGHDLIAYAVYLNIELRLPQIQVDNNLNRLFGFCLPVGSGTHTFKAQAAEAYRASSEALLKRLCSGSLLHVDETKISIRGKDGFVWVFANMKEVVYVFSETREGDMVQSLLKDFKGVLVTDFYAAYDAIECPQQKCLVHLIRDLNDDVLKHPYDHELKKVALSFALLLKPMVETIDRYGLKSHYLRKYQVSVEQFYRKIQNTKLQSDMGVKLQERLEKNRDKLFTFLKYDGVPWNNNNAEHAIKSFAALRNVIGGLTTVKGIRDYLVLLSLCQTCKYSGVDFLDFLRSGEMDIHAFSESRNGQARHA